MSIQHPAGIFPLQRPREEEHDGAIVASIRTSGESTHGNLKRTIEALGKMDTGQVDVQSEGDGCGILADIPRKIWTARSMLWVALPGWRATSASSSATFSFPRTSVRTSRLGRPGPCASSLPVERICSSNAQGSRSAKRWTPGACTGTHLLASRRRSGAKCPVESVEPTLFGIAKAIESQTPIHVALTLQQQRRIQGPGR